MLRDEFVDGGLGPGGEEVVVVDHDPAARAQVAIEIGERVGDRLVEIEVHVGKAHGRGPRTLAQRVTDQAGANVVALRGKADLREAGFDLGGIAAHLALVFFDAAESEDVVLQLILRRRLRQAGEGVVEPEMLRGAAEFVREQGGGGALGDPEFTDVTGLGEGPVQFGEDVHRLGDAGAEQAGHQLHATGPLRQRGKEQGPKPVMHLAHERRILEGGVRFERSHAAIASPQRTGEESARQRQFPFD